MNAAERKSQLSYVATVAGAICGGVGLALSLFALYRCPLTDSNADALPLCENTLSIAGGSLLVLGLAGMATRWWGRSAKAGTYFSGRRCEYPDLAGDSRALNLDAFLTPPYNKPLQTDKSG